MQPTLPANCGAISDAAAMPPGVGAGVGAGLSVRAVCTRNICHRAHSRPPHRFGPRLTTALTYLAPMKAFERLNGSGTGRVPHETASKESNAGLT